MSHVIAPISKGGQITLPAEMRRALGVKLGDNVSLTLSGATVSVTPVTYTAASLAGSIKVGNTGSPDYREVIEEAAEERAAEIIQKLRRR